MRILIISLLCLRLLTVGLEPVHASVLASSPALSSAPADGQSTYQTTTTTMGVTLQWDFHAATAATAPASTAQVWATLQQWPQMPYGDYLLPMRLETVLLPTAGAVSSVFEQVDATTWPMALPRASALAPTAIDWVSTAPPTFWEVQTVPTAPVFLLREGRMRGVRLGVIALSPLYVEAGVTKIALAGRVTIVGAYTVAAADLATVKDANLSAVVQRNAPQSILDLTTFSNQPVSLSPPAVAPTNPAVTKLSFSIEVTHAGMQQLSGAALLAAGLNASTPLAHLQVAFGGTPLPLEIRDSDGVLDSTTEVRFYARPAPASLQVGDRWNITDTYWLISEPAPTTDGYPRMAVRNVFPKLAPLRNSAYEQGIWEENRLYESTMAGTDGDHWFGASLEIEIVQPDNPASYPIATVALTPTLPLDYGSVAPSFFTLTGSARSIATHTLNVNLDKITQPLSWANTHFYEDWQHTFTQTVQTEQVELVLVAGFDPSMIRIDKLFWQQPVRLDFHSKGAAFLGVAGQWRYQLQNTPTERTLYDITNPAAPVILQLPNGPQTQFEDGPTVNHYLLAGPGTLYQPTMMRHTPVDFTTMAGADAVYITPAWLQAALAPLIEHRRQEGYQVQVIDVQQIYDAWSYGQVSPKAIRDFLRYVVSHWQPAPIAVTLVGDSTIDPRNYTGARNGVANVDLMPAYLASIDPWLKEAVCESCLAQLDGADPLDSTYDSGFLVDIALGRLSVQDEVQLQAVVDKMIHYEESAQRDPGAQWHRTALYVSDNYIQPNGTKDPAGDFPYYSDLIIEGDLSRGIGAIQPAQVLTRRLYYDPSADGVTQPWREPNAQLARLRTIEEINRGPGLVTYNGHGNHFLWATTNPDVDPPYLFGANDVFELTNYDQPAILLEMTCFTAQFTYISPSGYTIDERFFRHTNGGAVAVWGSSGLTVAIGQDWMQQGFHAKLWKSPPFQAHLGELIAAGYATLFASTTCCQETRSVYLLLGDPLTPVLLWEPKPLYLPLVMQK